MEIPATLRPSRKKHGLMFIVSLMFVLCGVVIIRDGNPIGYLCGGFFALCALIFAIQFHPKAAYLQLTSDGFTFCSLFRVFTVRWTQVKEFAEIRVGLNRMVGWNYKPEYAPAGRAAAMSKSMSGCEAALPDTYGLTPQELVELMENLRQRYGND